MALELTEGQAEKQELQTPEGAENTRTRRVFMPRTDIYETKDAIVVLADMPGVDDKSIDVTLEKNVLTINGFVDSEIPSGYSLTYAEYAVGDYRRIFTLSNEVDRDGITATVKNGVLKLVLPKSVQTKARKIAVKSE
jgi:HSP20 family protein